MQCLPSVAHVKCKLHAEHSLIGPLPYSLRKLFRPDVERQ